MLIRKNTKAFKTILEMFSACQTRSDREQLIRLFITKAGSTVKDRISVDAIQGDAALFYEMNYQTILNSLRSSNHQLYESDEIPGVYYFHSTSNKQWDETPFEFDEAVKKEFSSLPDLPIVRKKGKVEKFELPKPKTTSKAPVKKSKDVPIPKVKQAVARGPKQPDFKLRDDIEFTGLDKVVFRQPLMSKLDILTYYNSISDYILPYLEGRALWLTNNSSRADQMIQATKQSLFADDEDSAPEWLEGSGSKNKKRDTGQLMASDKEHLLLFVERGAWGFHPSLSREKQNENPDYMVITIDSPDAGITKAVDVALVMKTILDGLKLPSFIKANGASELHVYVPLDGKSTFEASKDCGKYICKLVKLKIPEQVSVAGADENSYGKVSIDYSLNEKDQTVVAPYSLVATDSVTVATPLLWEELEGALEPNAFEPTSILKRLKEVGDPLETLFKKKVNASNLSLALEANYGFLF